MQPSVGRELFAAGFASCWVKMNETSQEQLVRNLKTAFSSQNIPPEILATLLNLVCSYFILLNLVVLGEKCNDDVTNPIYFEIDQAEFMEHEEKPLPIDTRLLGALAEKVVFLPKKYCFHVIEYSYNYMNGAIFPSVSGICKGTSLQRNGV